ALNEQARLVLFGREDRLDEVTGFLDDLDQPSQEEVRVFNVEYQSAGEISDYIGEFFPELVVRARESVGDVIVSGQERKMAEVEDLIADLDRPDRTINERYRPSQLSAEELLEELERSRNLSSVNIRIEDGDLFLEGPARQVEQVAGALPGLDEREEVITHRKFQVDYLPLDDLEEIIRNFEEDIELSKNPTDRSMIIRAEERTLERVSDLIAEVDQPRKQVMLEARIEEVSHSALEERGIDLNELRDFTTIGVNYNDDGGISGVDLDLPELFNFYDSDAATQTLANPRLMTLDGEEASLVIADQVPIKVAEEETEAGRVVPVYEYRDVGITLKFTPTITKENTIQLEMLPEISSLGEESSDALLPVIQTRELESNISLRDGQTFAIGGLLQDDFSEQVRSVPLLSDLPILGELFKSRDKDKDRTEVIIYITPRIVDISDEGFDDADSVIDFRDGEVDFDSPGVIDEEKLMDADQRRDRGQSEDVSEPEDAAGAEDNAEVEAQPVDDGAGDDADTADDTAEAEERTARRVEDVMAEIMAQAENEEQEPVGRPDMDELRQITFRARMGRRDDWPEVYEFEFTSDQQYSEEYLMNLYNVSFENARYREADGQYEYLIVMDGNQAYQVDEDTTVLALAERTGITAERIIEANRFEDNEIEAGTVVILPYTQ
ncbi:MAG: secretin N-terminal domain-containing protein, partial [Halarsenatibacteraceae bacterium]